MLKIRWLSAGVLTAWCASSAALCSADLGASDIDAVSRRLQSHIADVGGETTAQLIMREGLIEQVGELQTVKLLVGLRESITGRENQLRVREALRAVMHAVGDNATALRELVARSALGADQATSLLADLDREIALMRCEEPGKKETPGAAGR